MRENTYDSDIFLLQVSMILFDPELFLATALDRFELLEWFSGQREHSTYDLLQIVFMAEELLTLLIVCVSDRVNTAGFTIEQEIRREIVHGLCLKPIAYSELTKRIPERLTEHVRFDDTLKELASYRAPDGITDHGLYELKDEFFDEVDPYFIHFSRNNSEEAEEILKSRITKKSGNTIKSPQILPRLSRIERGPFTSLGNLMHTKVMTQILFYTFWNVKAEPRIKSDTIIDQAAYIMQIAVLDPNNDSFRSLEQDLAGESTGNGMAGFMRHATFEKFPVIINGNERVRLSLLSILLQRADDPAYKSIHPKLSFVLNKFAEIGSNEAKAIVGQWKASKGPLESEESGSSEQAEAERKKLANQERQARIMAQFAQAQKSFMSLNEDLYDSDTDEDEDEAKEKNEDDDQPLDIGANKVAEAVWHYPTGTCIVCQEEMTQSSEYGMLAYVQPSHVLRQTPMDNSQFLLESTVSPLSLDVSATSIRPFGTASGFDKHSAAFGQEPESKSLLNSSSSGKSTSKEQPYRPQSTAKGFPTSSHRRGLYSSSCGHLMHIRCFETYVRSLQQRHDAQHNRNHPENPTQREYMCPLCKSLGNLLLPITWKGKKQTYPGVLISHQSAESWLGSGAMSVLQQLTQEKKDATAASAARVESSTGRRLSRGGLGLVPGFFRAATGVTGDPLPRPSESLSLSFSMGVPNQGAIEADSIKTMYLRLAEVFQMNHEDLLSPEEILTHNEHPSQVGQVDIMWEAFAYTISCVEITQRGVNAANGTSTLIAGIQQQTLTLLRMMADTIVSYSSLMVNRPENRVHLAQMSWNRLAKIIQGCPGLGRNEEAALSQIKPLLLEDPFFVLTELVFSSVEPSHLLETLYMVEIAKTIVGLVTTDLSALVAQEPRISSYCNSSLPALDASNSGILRSVVEFVIKELGVNEQAVASNLSRVPDQLLLKLVRSYTLPFLRKCALLFDARYGVLFPETQPAMSTAEPLDDEYARLASLLHLPELLPMCAKWTSENVLRGIVGSWCRDLTSSSKDSVLPGLSRPGDPDMSNVMVGASSTSTPSNSTLKVPMPIIGLNHPAIYELVGLPRRLDALFEQSIKYICPRCNTVPHDPALCLCCGTIVCSQSFCCLDGVDHDGRGECNTHALT